LSLQSMFENTFTRKNDRVCVTCYMWLWYGLVHTKLFK